MTNPIPPTPTPPPAPTTPNDVRTRLINHYGFTQGHLNGLASSGVDLGAVLDFLQKYGPTVVQMLLDVTKVVKG